MGNNTAARLRQGIEALESIDQEIEEFKERIKALKADRKGTMDQTRADTGFVPKVQDQIVRERRMDPESRTHFAVQLQLARGVMGMLDGTPLGDAARKAFERPAPPPSETWVSDDRQDGLPEIDEPEPQSKPITADDIKQARQAGIDAAQAGLKVSDNPYAADQAPLRAAWDEGWCWENGSDGMEIPEELRRKKKKGDADGNDNLADDGRKAA